MASNPSNCNVTVTSATNVNCSPDPVVVAKHGNSAHDGVEWTINNKDWIFTGVIIAGTTYTPASATSSDFGGCTIDNSQPNGQDKKSIMVIDDSLAEIIHEGQQEDYSYTLNISARDGSSSFAYDPNIRNKW